LLLFKDIIRGFALLVYGLDLLDHVLVLVVYLELLLASLSILQDDIDEQRDVSNESNIFHLETCFDAEEHLQSLNELLDPFVL
jgi:hypothetical protein